MRNKLADICCKLDKYDVLFAMKVPETDCWNIQVKLAEGSETNNELYNLVTSLHGFMECSWAVLKADKDDTKQTWDLTIKEVDRADN